MRILAIDHGSRRIGIAVSDELKLIAQPLEFIPAEPFTDFLARLQELLREKEVELILVGLPRDMDVRPGPAALKVPAFLAAQAGDVGSRVVSVAAPATPLRVSLGGRRTTTTL